jgi:predicted permease
MSALLHDPALEGLLGLMGQMFIFAVCGIVLRRKKILPDQARTILTDLVMDLILPANIIHSFEVEFSFSILQKFLLILVIASAAQAVSMVFAGTLWKGQPAHMKRVLQYATQVSN